AVPVALALVAGLVMGQGRSPSFAAVVLLAGAACALSSRFVPPRMATILLLLAVASCGSARSAAYERRLAWARSPLDPETELRFEASVAEPPSRESGEASAVVAVRWSRPALPDGTHLRLRFPAGQSIEWSDRVRGLARVDVPEPARNPGGLDGLRFANA